MSLGKILAIILVIILMPVAVLGVSVVNSISEINATRHAAEAIGADPAEMQNLIRQFQAAGVK